MGLFFANWFRKGFTMWFRPKVKPKTGMCAFFGIPVKKKAVCHNEQSASLLSSLELSHVPKYAPSFSLSAPCILLTLTRRLRVISNAYFDTPSLVKLGTISGSCDETTFGELFLLGRLDVQFHRLHHVFRGQDGFEFFLGKDFLFQNQIGFHSLSVFLKQL